MAWTNSSVVLIVKTMTISPWIIAQVHVVVNSCDNILPLNFQIMNLSNEKTKQFVSNCKMILEKTLNF